MDEWYYQRGEATFGPISGVMLHGLLKRGRLQDDTLVRKSGEVEWSSLAEALVELPAVADAPLALAEPYTNAQPFDASQPGASEVYAPPQSALEVRPETGLPTSLWVGMIFCSATLLFEIASWSLVCMQLLRFNQPEGASSLESPQSLVEGLAFQTALLASVISTFATIIWQGCAFASLKRLYGDMVRRSVWSGLWWLVPIASLFMPMLCLRDMRHLSRRRRDVLNLHVPFGPLLITMETLIVLRIPISIMEGTNVSPHGEGGSHMVLDLVSNFAIIALAATLLAFVIRNFLQQRTLYAHWTDDPYWQDQGRQ
jgi:hypothetical protein